MQEPALLSSLKVTGAFHFLLLPTISHSIPMLHTLKNCQSDLTPQPAELLMVSASQGWGRTGEKKALCLLHPRQVRQSRPMCRTEPNLSWVSCLVARPVEPQRDSVSEKSIYDTLQINLRVEMWQKVGYVVFVWRLIRAFGEFTGVWACSDNSLGSSEKFCLHTSASPVPYTAQWRMSICFDVHQKPAVLHRTNTYSTILPFFIWGY